MSKIILQGHLLIHDSALQAVWTELPRHIRLTINEPGCITFEVTQDSENPRRFQVYEEFTDRTSFEYHQERVKTSDWGKITANADRQYQVTVG